MASTNSEKPIIFDARAVARYYWRHASKYKPNVVGLFIVLPLTILVNNYLPALILANVLSKLAENNFAQGAIWSSFGPEIVGYTVLLLGGIAAWRVVDKMVWRLERNVQRDIAREVFAHMLGRSADFHANNFGGSLVSQTNKLLGGYVRTADTTIFNALPMLAGVVIATIILLPRAPLFAALLVAFALLYVLAALVVTRPVRKLGSIYASYESRQTGFLADSISNVMAIKSFARADYEKKRFAKTTDLTHKHLGVFARAHQKQMNALGVMNRSISASSLLVAVIAVVTFGADIATVFLIFNYTATIVDQLFNFSNNGLRNYNRAIGDASELVHTLSQEAEIQDPEKPIKVHMPRGLVRFEDVTFTHNGSDAPIFKKLNIRIKPGEKVGLVGHSGSGKTTFTRLLLRFSDIQSGTISIDGQDITSVSLNDLNSHITYVPQEPLLFHRTIRENIGYGDLSASQEAIEATAKMAHAHEFVETLPQGYDTLVGERGVKLSGGQRQRVAIARAMLKNAPILVLDEATSALDSESEVLIQDALWKLMEGRTAIVIAHRLSTIQKMDRILVMDKGKIAEEGTHRQLLQKKNGIYAGLWKHQSGGFLEE